MRFTVTPLGASGGRTVGAVVDDIVRYLEPRTQKHSLTSPGVPGGDGPSSYYADRGTEAGRWLGIGAAEAGLEGQVVAADFARVLAGRDPATGARLITAQGSAGRRRTLGAGTETRRDPDGLALYGTADVAAALGVTHREAEALVAAGERQAARSLAALAGGKMIRPDPPAGFLVPYIDAEGNRWVNEAELDRCEAARGRGTTPEELAAGGQPDDQLLLTEAARLAGVTARYLRGVCRRYETNQDEIACAMEDGTTPKRAYLVSYRGTKGQWLVKREDLVAFLDRRAAPAVRVGYDLTLTTEKSLGVLALLGTDDVRAGVLDAIEAGNDVALGYLERHVAAARSQGKPVLVRGWTVASFRHLTSRALDPFPHHHNVVANTVVDEGGTRRALDARGLYWHAQEASALATAEMRHRLTATLGVRWRPGRSGGWEIDGISEEVVRGFSRRRTEIDDALAELEEAIGRRSNLEEVQAIVASTRPAKQEVDPRSLVNGWWERARSYGLRSQDLARCTGRDSLAIGKPVDERAVFIQLSSPEDGLCAGRSIFTRSDVLAALVDLPVPSADGSPQPLVVTAAELERLADTFLISEHVVELLPHGLSHTSQLGREPIFTTPEILAVQKRICDRYVSGLGNGGAVALGEHVEHALLQTPGATEEQADLVRRFCTSGDRVQCGIGRAGAGKTTTMRAAAKAWHASGFRVLGTAVKGEAARHLGDGAAIPTETVAWFLARRDWEPPPLDGRTVLIVDEASTLSDRDLEALIGLAQRTGATVRLIGDPDQHGAVAAGGMFRVLCERHRERTPELKTTHRLGDEHDRAAATALREGRIDEALALLDKAGHLHVADNDVALYAGMLERWWRGRCEGGEHPMVDRRHRTRRQLNRLARQVLRANGQLGDRELRASGDRAFAAGDRVVARMAARDLHPPGAPTAYVRNSAVGTVREVLSGETGEHDRLRVDFDGIGTIEVPRRFFDEHPGPGGRRDVGLDHAYAVTSYAVQGATFQTSTSRIDDGASRSEAYVDITRGRQSNHLFLTRAVGPLDGEHLPRVAPPPLAEAVARRLRGSGPERVAVEVDPSAIQSEDGERAARRAARAAVHELPATLLERLPAPGPAQPVHLARRRNKAIQSVASYRARWHPQSGTARWEWALGRPVANNEALKQRNDAIVILERYATARAAEELRQLGWGELPPWALRHVTTAAASERSIENWTRLAALYRRVDDYRQAINLPDEVEESPYPLADILGPVPDDPLTALARRDLARELQEVASLTHAPPLRRR